MQTISTQTVDALKSNGYHFAAGALSKSLGHGRAYGCHFGMRSDLESSREAFYRGYDACPKVER